MLRLAGVLNLLVVDGLRACVVVEVEEKRAHNRRALAACGLVLLHDVRANLLSNAHDLDDCRLGFVSKHPN